MTTNRRSAGVPARRGTEPRNWARPPGLALLALALVGLVQAGCRSDGCNNCSLNGIGRKLTNGVETLGARVFHHGERGCSNCGDGGVGGSEEGMIVGDSGISMAPGAMVVPAPGTILPPPGIESAPTQLDPIPSTSGSQPASPTGGTGSANPSSTRGAPANTRSGYEAYLPRGSGARRRTNDVARAIHSSPEAARPARAATAPGDSEDLFAHIPPVDAISEATGKSVNLPAPPARPAPAPAPTAATPAAAPAPENASKAAPTAAETVSAVEGAAIAIPGRLAPGIRRSESVAPSVGGGSAPSADGLDWLKEKGYRTFLDLRSVTEIDPKFVEAVNDHDMFYISLPIVAAHLDPSRLARFDELIARTDNRPLYFCDADGTRAGLIWYLHLRTVEGLDAQSAAQRSEEIGLTDTQARLAEAYLAARKPQPKAAAAASAQVVATAKVVEPARAPEPQAGPSPTSASLTPATPPAPSDTPPAPMLPGEDRPQASATPDLSRFRDASSWRSVAALVLSGIGLPLAYWSKTALNGARLPRRRASLPAAERRSLGSPAGSDA